MTQHVRMNPHFKANTPAGLHRTDYGGWFAVGIFRSGNDD